MSELGARLRQAREGQGLSLAQASVDTRILQQSLVALEEGAFQRLPSDVVIRGFLRNYAQYLGLPPEEMIELYRSERGATDRIRVVAATTPPRTRLYVLPSFFGVFFVTIALVGLAYVGLNAVGRIGDRVTPDAVALATATVPPPTPLATATAGVAPTFTLPGQTPGPPAATTLPTVIGTVVAESGSAQPAGGLVPPDLDAPTRVVVTPGPSPTPAAPIMLEIVIPRTRGNESSWVRVQTDGNVAFEGIMRSGEKQLFQAQRRVVVRAGNPPDVFVTVNGLQQGALGQRSGQPVNWTWPLN